MPSHPPGDISGVRERSRIEIPIRNGALGTFITFDGLGPGADHFAVSFGPAARGAPLVRMHSECITGDVFGSLRCDCGAQLEQSLDWFAAAGGVLLYLRQEGRGIGLLAKLDAYVLQDRGLDTFAANRALSLPADARSYSCGAAMLRALGIPSIRLITNNPDKRLQLEQHGIEVLETIPTDTFVTTFNRDYLSAKARVGGHALDPQALAAG